MLLIAVASAAFLWELLSRDIAVLLREWAARPSAMHFSESSTLLPLVTASFLHADFLHLLLNMWYLWIFGDNVEDRMGRGAFLIFYVAAGAATVGSQALVSGPEGRIILGASGAVSAVLGAYLVLFPHHRVDTVVPVLPIVRLQVPAYVLLVVWMLIQFVGVFTMFTASAAHGRAVAWVAHLVGFGAGCGVGGVLRRKGERSSP